MKNLLDYRIGRSCILSFLFFTICIYAFGQQKHAPDWVRSIPVNENAFFGLGTADIRNNDSFRSQARKVALKEIAEKIYISINSSSEFRMTYVDDQVDYSLDETILTETSSFLSGHYQVDDWIDKRSNTYYVLYRLNKLTFMENRRTYFEGLDQLMRFIRTTSDSLVTEGQLVRGINKLEELILISDSILLRPIEPEYQIYLEKTRLSAVYQLEDHIKRVQFDLEDYYEFGVDSAPLVFTNFLRDRVTRQPIYGLDTKLNVQRGDVFNYAVNHYSDHEELRINGLFHENKFSIVQLKVDIPVQEPTISLLDPAVNLEITSAPIRVEFKPYAIYFDSQEINGNQSEVEPVYTNYLRKITEDLGLTETDSEEEAFYRITVKTKRISEKYHRGYYHSTYYATVLIDRVSDNSRVFEFVLQPQSGESSKRSVAHSRSFKKLLDANTQFLVSFVTTLCTWKEF